MDFLSFIKICKIIQFIALRENKMLYVFICLPSAYDSHYKHVNFNTNALISYIFQNKKNAFMHINGFL